MTFNAREIVEKVVKELNDLSHESGQRDLSLVAMIQYALHDAYLIGRTEQIVEIENIYSDVGCSWDHCGCKKEFMDEIREAEKKIGEEK